MKKGSGVEAGRFASSWGEVTSSDIDPSDRIQTSRVKRTLDVALALTLLIVVSPLMLLIAMLIKLADGGPAIFVQRRCGANGKTFSCYKFRTMHVNANERLDKLLSTDPEAAKEWGAYQKLRKDPRVTAFGRFLRKSSLDELPQLINILRGEMSVVGPRPITSDEIYRYGPHFKYYAATRPGVLGLWQISGRSAVAYDKRVLMDVEYVKTWSVWNDIKILFRSIPVVLFGWGAY